MNDSINYIDNYFTGALSDDEKTDFEQKCAADQSFAKEVAEYISMRDAINGYLQQQKREDFATLYQELSTPSKLAKIILLKRIAYLAAACILLTIGWFSFLRHSKSQLIATNYISGNLNTLGLNMGVSDSLQMGITAYNSKSYLAAEQLFKPLTYRQTTASEATKYLGLTYLADKQYEAAINSFDQLAAMPLYVNPGQFYKALTLMERSKGTDRQQAKKILQQIIDKRLYGYQQASNWINQF
jgi:tetratricopeptide (TPR) repeat protein